MVYHTAYSRLLQWYIILLTAGCCSGISYRLQQAVAVVKGAKSIAEALKLNTSLKEIYLYQNQIGDEGGKAIGEALKLNTSLRDISVSGNENINQEIKTEIEKKLKLNFKQKEQKKLFLLSQFNEKNELKKQKQGTKRKQTDTFEKSQKRRRKKFK